MYILQLCYVGDIGHSFTRSHNAHCMSARVSCHFIQNARKSDKVYAFSYFKYSRRVKYFRSITIAKCRDGLQLHTKKRMQEIPTELTRQKIIHRVSYIDSVAGKPMDD